MKTFKKTFLPIFLALVIALTLAFGALWHHTDLFNKSEQPPTSEKPPIETPGDDEQTPTDKINVIYFLKENDAGIVAEIEYTVGEEITEPAVPEKAGYVGTWEAYELNGGTVTVNPVYEVITYTISYGIYYDGHFFDIFNPSTQENVLIDNNATYPTTYTVEDGSVTIPNLLPYVTLNDAVYTFEGWYLDNELTQAFNGVIESGSTGDVVLYAKTAKNLLTNNEPTITFIADGVTVDTFNYTVGEEITEPAVPEKAGYVGTWEAYELNGGTVTVNAVYEVITYTISYIYSSQNYDVFPHFDTLKEDGGNYPTTYTVESGDITISNLKNGKINGWSYTFEGWYLDNELTQAFDGVIESGSTGDVVLYLAYDSWSPMV